MRLLEFHVVPVWQETNGVYTYGMRPRPNHPPVIGWANVMIVEIHGTVYPLLLVHEEVEADA